MRSAVLTNAAVGRDRNGGGEEFGGGANGLDGGDGLRWSSGRGRVRTGTTRWRRCRWCGRGGRGVDDGGAIGGGAVAAGGDEISKCGEHTARERE